MDLLCSSQSATAICSSMAEITHAASSSSSSSAPVVHLGRGDGGRAIDRFNPIITDSRRRTQPARNPAGPAQQSDTKPTKKNDNKENKKKKKKKNKSDSTKPPATRGGGGWRCTKPGDFVTPQSSSSSRYLLNDENDGFLDSVSGFDPILKPEDPNCNGMVHQAAEEVSSSSSHPQSGPTDNKVVVVLRVSLHCRGCEKKMRKHISRMQGVSSFNIDFVAKKVTVVGDVTPLGVLASISKVKTAQLWSPPPPYAAARRV
ncbi:unnamed protein product [Cuscuta campestris]|uniref:HMA domain-containing protein n=1 Tax=Cuscuta campestris TaxID=132261 RepID=A0A484KEJ8_9ASTE|nr:unnamed protein product [Cuscuta campestris]